MYALLSPSSSTKTPKLSLPLQRNDGTRYMAHTESTSMDNRGADGAKLNRFLSRVSGMREAKIYCSLYIVRVTYKNKLSQAQAHHILNVVQFYEYMRHTQPHIQNYTHSERVLVCIHKTHTQIYVYRAYKFPMETISINLFGACAFSIKPKF